MGTTPVCQITDAGIVRPTFENVLGYCQSAYRGIYGQDVYLGADSQDGQLVALWANSIHDANGETVAAYNAFSPATARGAGLSSVVKTNGIRRKSATYSTVDLLIVGQVGSVITEGAVRDANGLRWNLPESVTIPRAGQIRVTATCSVLGAVAAPTGTITSIATPTLGWQSVTNPSAAAPGLPIETDSQLRRRQALSTGLPAQTALEAMAGAILAIQGVNRLRVYENDGNVPDANGIPAHALAVIVEGGDADNIAALIAAKKTPGVGTYGDILVTRKDAYGIAHPIRFSRTVLTKVAWQVSLRARDGYTVDVRSAIQSALAAYTNGLGIGEGQSLAGGYPAANLTGDPRSITFEIVGLSARRANTSNDAYGDIGAAYNERLVADPADVMVTVV